VHVVREAARATDPRDEDDVLLRETEVRHRLLHGAQDRVVSAPGTPPHVLVGLEVLLRVLRDTARRGLGRSCHGTHCLASAIWWIASRMSWLASGMPATRL